MYLVTLEDDDGMWVQDPIAADTKEEAEKLARTAWPNPPMHVARMLYRCDLVREIETTAAAADVRTYKLKRWHNGRLMAEGAEVHATSDDEAIAQARELFHESEYRHDKFEIEAVE